MSSPIVERHEWVVNRPTSIGKYYLSLHPTQRGNLSAVLRAEIRPSPRWFSEKLEDLAVYCDTDAGTLFIGIESSRLDGALWRLYAEPTDPHKKES